VSRRWWPLLLVAVGGCAYFNGVYNAERTGTRGERQWAAGEYATAVDSFRQSAAHAETVLVRFPKSRWRNEALFLSARGAAFAGDCASARPRLTEYLAVPGEPSERVDRARLASAICLYEDNKFLPADSILRTLLDHPEPPVRDVSAMYSARIAVALGDPDRAQTLLSRIPGTAAAWENIDAAFLAVDYAAAESLLVTRAAAGDWRSEVPRRVAALWAAGRYDGVVEVATRYAQSRAPTTNRAQLLLLTSDLAAQRGDTATARRLVLEARRIGVSSQVEAPVAARLLGLRLSGLSELSDVRLALARDSMLARGTPELRRISNGMLLIELCLKRADRYGAGIFLAAEFARDSLRAPLLAHSLFTMVEREQPDSPIAARALMAAAQLLPDSAAVYEARVLAEWPMAGVSARLRGLSPRDSSTQSGEDGALNQAFVVITTQFADSMRALVRGDSARRADSIAAVQRARGRGQ
jgi:hypothetical protein